MKRPKDLRTKEGKKWKAEQSKGFGDTIAKVTKATGIDKLIGAIVDDCGCEERKKTLNKLFPYHKNITMTIDQQQIWVMIRAELHGTIVNAETRERLRIMYNNIFGDRQQPSTCAPCIIKQRDKVSKVYQNVCND
jgi:hypothetical protein